MQVIVVYGTKKKTKQVNGSFLLNLKDTFMGILIQIQRIVVMLGYALRVHLAVIQNSQLKKDRNTGLTAMLRFSMDARSTACFVKTLLINTSQSVD
jgi:hypothetical protein